MKVTQTLSSGLFVRQDFSDAVRPVFFQTDFEEFLYATHGGTLFLVRYKGLDYGLTCRHVFGDFKAEQLFITQEKQAKKDSKPAPIQSLCYPSSPRDGAIGTDIIDVCVLKFKADTPLEFFKNSSYIIDDKTVATASIGDRLLVSGVLKEKCFIIPPDITIGYCVLELQDMGAPSADPLHRKAAAEFLSPKFNNVTGLSGSPVFDVTKNALCGMVARGGMTSNKCTLHYIDIFDIVRFLEAVSTGASEAYYFKHVSSD